MYTWSPRERVAAERRRALTLTGDSLCASRDHSCLVRFSLSLYGQDSLRASIGDAHVSCVLQLVMHTASTEVWTCLPSCQATKSLACPVARPPRASGISRWQQVAPAVGPKAVAIALSTVSLRVRVPKQVILWPYMPI